MVPLLSYLIEAYRLFHNRSYPFDTHSDFFGKFISKKSVIQTSRLFCSPSENT